jgi:hypothetical protein
MLILRLNPSANPLGEPGATVARIIADFQPYFRSKQ